MQSHGAKTLAPLRPGFVLAGLTNIIGVLVVSEGFTSVHLGASFPRDARSWSMGFGSRTARSGRAPRLAKR